ncbi:MAG: hypothetical protein NTX64_01300 [Elusimicrobia bacterium]|nr:hypothetical protein [Elusimicrobiota bacterium]
MIGILAALVLAAPSIAAGPLCDLPKADRAFEQRQYQPALEAYEGALKACEGEERLRALYRAAESKSLLFRYAEAAQLLRGEKLPSDPLWRARFLILKAELARENLEQYGFAAPEDEEAGPEGEANDVTRRTQEQWRTEAFRGLWVLRDAMLARSIRDEDYFVELKDSDLQRVPTLWDFAVYRWADFLLAQLPEQAPRPPAARFLDRDFNRDVLDQDPPAVEAAALYENAALAAGDDRVAARELWKLARLLIPFEHSQAVELGDLDAARKSAIETLKSWRDTFTQPRPRAEAALQAARFSEALGRHADCAGERKAGGRRKTRRASARGCAPRSSSRASN